MVGEIDAVQTLGEFLDESNAQNNSLRRVTVGAGGYQLVIANIYHSTAGISEKFVGKLLTCMTLRHTHQRPVIFINSSE